MSTNVCIPSSAIERESTVVASKWAKVVAGAAYKTENTILNQMDSHMYMTAYIDVPGSVKSSAGTYTACTEVIEPFLVDVIRS